MRPSPTQYLFWCTYILCNQNYVHKTVHSYGPKRKRCNCTAAVTILSICNFPLICQWMAFLRLPFTTVIHTTYLLANQYLPTLKISMDWRSLIHRNVWLRSAAKRCWTLHCSWTAVFTCCWANKAIQQCSSEIKYASSSIGIGVTFFFFLPADAVFV